MNGGGFTVGADELRGQPGIFFRRGEGDNDEFLFVNVRGVIGNHGNDVFLALVDGIPFVGPEEEVLMTDVPYAAVDTIEIVRGPVSALYGRGGIAGAINYSLLTPSDATTRLSLGGGTDGHAHGRLTMHRSLGDHRILISADALSADGWRKNNAQERMSLFGRGVFQLGPGTALSAYLNLLDREYETGSVIPTFADGELVEVAGGREAFYGSRATGQDRRSSMAAARLSHVVGPTLSFDATLHSRQTDAQAKLDFYDFFGFDPSRNVLTVNGFDSDTESRTHFAEAQLSWAAKRATTILGFNFEQADLEERDWWSGQFGFTFDCGFAFFAIEIDYQTGRIVNADHPCFVDRLPRLVADSRNTFWSSFGQTELALSDRLTLTVGARYDRFERSTELTTGTPLVDQERVDVEEDHVSPKLSLAWRLAPEHLVYATYGQGFSSNFGPVWQWDPSRFVRDTKPTTLDNVEVGIKGSAFDRKLDYALALFAIDQRDRLVFVSNPASFDDPTLPPTIATSGQKYVSEGLELSARARLTRDTTLRLGYSHVEAEWDELILEGFAGPIDLSGKAPTGVPEDLGEISLEQKVGDRLDLRLSWEWYGDYFVTQDNSVRGGSYDLVNLGASYVVDRGLLDRLDLSITNLLDQRYNYLFGGSRTFATNAVPGVPLQARLTLGLRF